MSWPRPTPRRCACWRVYQARIRANLRHALRPRTADPAGAAETLAALIDGLYIRAALSHPEMPQAAETHALGVLKTLTEARA